MELPGGLLVDSQIRRDFSFKPMTGFIERAIAESGLEASGLPQQVTTILTTSLNKVAGLTANRELVLSLSSGDRLFLMLQLEANIKPEIKWMTASCQHCKELIQFQYEPGSMPVKLAGENFPQATLSLSIADVSIRVPNGTDEEYIAQMGTQASSTMEHLLARLLNEPDSSVDLHSLTNQDKELIDNTLELMAAQPGESVSISCPFCSQQQQIFIDNYAWINTETDNIDEEVHTLASQYHWSENDILSLSRDRRKCYLQLIEKSQNTSQTENQFQQSGCV